MTSRATTAAIGRSQQIDLVSRRLLPGAALLTRLVVRELGAEISRTEVGLLSTLSGGPQRITALAELEGLAQPTTTTIVKELERRGLVRRERQADDGRVVLVNLTDAGRVTLEDYRSRVRSMLGTYLNEIPDEQVEALAAATDALVGLIALLQQPAGGYPTTT
jgi:DNA-binding MarR family transcriptional regulator